MDRLKNERKRLGLTQKAMAALLWGMPHRTYQDIEAGVRVPPPWVLEAIFERLARKRSAPGSGPPAASP
jgi:DNA-binding XRE family transcriptional regulator